ncbi:MFS transporter [Pedobacter ginsenosidimutans]
MVLAILTIEFGVIGLLPEIATYYKINISEAGFLLSAFALVVAISGPFMTFFSSRFDRKKVMMVSVLMFLFSSLLSSFSPPFWLLLLVRIIPAFTLSVYYAAAIATVIGMADKKDHHKLMAITLSGISISTVSTIPLSTFIASVLAWQYAFLFQVIICAVAFIAILVAVPLMPSKEKKSIGNQLQILKNKNVWFSLLMNMFMFSAEFAMYSYFADYMVQVKHMNLTHVSYLMLVFGITGLLGIWIAGRILSKSLSVTNIIFLVGCNVVVPVALYYSGYTTLLVSLMVACWGILYAPGFLIATSAVSSEAPEAVEFANGLMSSFANLGITVGIATGGWVILHSGISSIPFISVVFGLIAVVFVLLNRRKKSNIPKEML